MASREVPIAEADVRAGPQVIYRRSKQCDKQQSTLVTCATWPAKPSWSYMCGRIATVLRCMSVYVACTACPGISLNAVAMSGWALVTGSCYDTIRPPQSHSWLWPSGMRKGWVE